MQAGNANSMAPDYKKAMISASRLYQLLDREPEIDGLSEEGEKPQVRGRTVFDWVGVGKK